MQRKQGKQKKVLSGMTALVCVAALLITGTFAWRGVSSALNVFSDTKVTPTTVGANLHDDFDKTTGDKNVYAENTGESDVYVRIQLTELLNKGATTPGTQTPVIYAPTDLTNSGNNYNAYGGAFKWTLGNTAPVGYNSIMGSAAWNSAADRSAKDNLVGDAFGGAQNNGSTIVDLKGATTTAKVAPAGTVITMAAYNAKSAADKATFVGWIYDTDGWAYWSQPLAGGATTSLLLDKVAMPAAGSETYYYAINAKMEYVDEVDLPAWTAGAEIQEGAGAGTTPGLGTTTQLAKNLLNGISGSGSTIKGVVGETFEASGYEWVILDIDAQGNALVVTKHVLGDTVFNTNAEDGNQYEGSTIDGAMSNFYATLKVADASGTGLKITDMALTSNVYANTPMWSAAGGKSAVATGGKEGFFALSYQEVSDLFAENADRAATRTNGFTATYWLRSAGSYPTGATYVGSAGGRILNTSVDRSFGFRPALWITCE